MSTNPSGMMASLPMYDLPEIRDATDAWWDGLARHMKACGVEGVPAALTRPAGDLYVHWRAPELLLSQTCGYPLTHALAGKVTYLATLHYESEGCEGASYSSRILVRADDSRRGLGDFEGARVAFNGPDSQSGVHALRSAVARILKPGSGHFFGEAIETGGHRESVAAVADGRADLCAVDAVTYELLLVHAPSAVSGLRCLCFTERTPGLPYITHVNATQAEIDAMRRALELSVSDPGLAEARSVLRIAGMTVLDMSAYSAISQMERIADSVLGKRLF